MEGSRDISTDMPTLLADFEKARFSAMTKVGAEKFNEDNSWASWLLTPVTKILRVSADDVLSRHCPVRRVWFTIFKY